MASLGKVGDQRRKLTPIGRATVIDLPPRNLAFDGITGFYAGMDVLDVANIDSSGYCIFI